MLEVTDGSYFDCQLAVRSQNNLPTAGSGVNNWQCGRSFKPSPITTNPGYKYNFVDESALFTVGRSILSAVLMLMLIH